MSSGASVHLQRHAGGIDMEAMWAAAKQAEAERVVRATALQKDQKDKGKVKGKGQIGKLKAMMDRADAEMREAARKLPRSERMPVQPPAASARWALPPQARPPWTLQGLAVYHQSVQMGIAHLAAHNQRTVFVRCVCCATMRIESRYTLPSQIMGKRCPVTMQTYPDVTEISAVGATQHRFQGWAFHAAAGTCLVTETV